MRAGKRDTDGRLASVQNALMAQEEAMRRGDRDKKQLADKLSGLERALANAEAEKQQLQVSRLLLWFLLLLLLLFFAISCWSYSLVVLVSLASRIDLVAVVSLVALVAVCCFCGCCCYQRQGSETAMLQHATSLHVL